MSRLDSHVAAVQNRLAFMRFLDVLAWALLAVCVAALTSVLLERTLHLATPRFWMSLGIAAGVATVIAFVIAFARRPSKEVAAVAIDEKLGLQAKISSALFLRAERKDPFAVAAVRDAEATAANVIVRKSSHFPLRWTRVYIATVMVAIVALLTGWLMPSLDLFGREEATKKAQVVEAKRATAEKTVKTALASVMAVPAQLQGNEAIKQAKADLAEILNKPIADPGKANRSAAKALQDVNEAMKQEIAKSSRFAEAQNEMKSFRSAMPAPEDKGPVADAQRSLAKGDFSDAVSQLDKAVNNFNKMEKKDQKQAAQQMNNLAKQLQQMAEKAQDPQQQQQLQQALQQQMQKAGMNQQQAQQQAQKMAQAMQQAAQGNPQAQQQLQQMAQQAMQQLQQQAAAGNPQAQQALQQANQMMQQMQQQGMKGQQAQQLAQAAQRMAQAMQQQQQAQQQGQQNPAGQKQAGQQQQQMQQAAQQMQQQLQQMQAVAADAQQMQAQQQAMQKAADQAGQAGNQGQGGKGDGKDGTWNGNDPGNWQAGQPQGQPGQQAGAGGLGQGMGKRDNAPAPFSLKPEMSPSQDNDKGRVLASTFVKDNEPLRGQAKANLQQVATAAEQDATDEVDADRVPRSAQKAVRDYFGSMQADAPPAAATQP